MIDLPKALVVDNNPVLLKAISTLVGREGYSVYTAEDGLQALEILKTVPLAIVFTDLVMPLVGGDQLCRIIRQTPELKHIFIVLISAVPLAEAQRLMASLPCDLCIVKGSLTEIKNNIREALTQFGHRTHQSARILGTQNRSSDDAQIGGQSIAGEILAEKVHREEIVACLSEGVIEMNDRGTVVEVNRAALNILDLGIAEVIGVGLDTLSWGEHLQAIAGWVCKELREKGMTALHIGDDQPIKRNGKVLTMTLLAVAGANHFGICIIRDITRQYRAEQYQQKIDQAIRLVKKMDALSGMAGGVAHDFNNLLAIICGSIDVAALALDSEEPHLVKEKLELAKQSAQSAVELVRKISQSSSYGIIDREHTEMTGFIRHAIESYPEELTAEISYFFGEPGRGVLLDRRQMTTAIHNIIQNSVEAGATHLQFSLERCKLERSLVASGQYVPDGSYMQVTIIDDGRGIAPHHITEIFDPYYSTKERGIAKGMGLGLAVVYSTVRNHGGYVLVTSEWGQGTRVSLYLPITGQADGVTPDGETLAGMSIVLLEPDEQICTVATAMLEYLGLQVLPADTAERALLLSRRVVERGDWLAGVLINLASDEDQEATSLCRQLRAEHQELVIIATSGSSSGPIMGDSRKYGFSSALPKPYGLDDLRSVLASVRRLRSTRDS